MSKKSTINISFTDYSSISELSEEFQSILVKAKEMSVNAYAPYSKFKVGAAVLLENGTTVGGNNQENGAYPAGLCAERVAIFAASAQNEDAKFKAIAVYAEMDGQISPCGSCRQVVMEYEQKQGFPIIWLLMNKAGEVRKMDTTSSLLPFAFKFDHFNK